MNFDSYIAHFEDVLAHPIPPYDNPDYYNYAKLNWSRMNRWLKHGKLDEELKTIISSIEKPMKWLIITEPWCGDAAHVTPFLQMAAALNPKITVEYELRDQEPFQINQYLTNGGKSIPKLIVRDEEGNDLATWGPRPAACQIVYAQLTEEKADFETVKTALQKWYNENAGVEIQKELIGLMNKLD